MAGQWNPSTPGGAGLEWMATTEFEHAIHTGANIFAQGIRSTVPNTIDAFRLPIRGTPGVTAPLYTIMEVFNRADVVSSGRTSVVYHPNQDGPGSDIGNGTGWERLGGSLVNLWASIDDTPQIPLLDNDYIGINNGTGVPRAYMCHVGSAAFPAGARVLRLRIMSVDATTPSPNYGSLPFAYRLYYIPTATFYTPPNANFVNDFYGDLRNINCGEINPVTGLPWTPADVQEFDIGGDWMVRVESVGNANTNPIVHALALAVDYAPVENRVAAGVWARPSGNPGTEAFVNPVVTLPSGAANWSKPASGDFVFEWRRADARLLTGSQQLADDIRWRAVGSDLSPVETAVFPPPPGMVGDFVSVNDFGQITTAVTGEFKRAAGLGLRLAGGGVNYDDDGQPYVLGLAQLLLVDAANGPAATRLRQTSGITRNYLGFRFLCIPPASGNSTLTVTVFATGTGIQTGGSFVLTAEEARAMPSTDSGWRLVKANLSAAASLTSGVQYEVRWTVSGADDWILPAPDSISNNGQVTFGGITDGMRLGANFNANRDIPVVLLIQPDPPTGVAAAVQTIDLYAAPSTGCKPRQRDQVVVTWTPTVLGSAFLRYEIERLEPDGVTWSPVQWITTEATASWTDLESVRNRPVQYRIRSRANSQAFSAWAMTAPVTPVTYGPDLILCSNARPDLTVVIDYEPRVPFDFNDHRLDAAYPVHGGPGYLVFIDPDDRGVSPTYRAIVNFKSPPTDGAGNLIGLGAMWEPLRRLSRAPGLPAPDSIPYVCVLDRYGNRTFGHLTLDNGLSDQPAHRYHCDITVLPVQDSPTIFVD